MFLFTVYVLSTHTVWSASMLLVQKEGQGSIFFIKLFVRGLYHITNFNYTALIIYIVCVCKTDWQTDRVCVFLLYGEAQF